MFNAIHFSKKIKYMYLRKQPRIIKFFFKELITMSPLLIFIYFDIFSYIQKKMKLT